MLIGLYPANGDREKRSGSYKVTGTTDQSAFAVSDCAKIENRYNSAYEGATGPIGGGK